MKSRMQTTAALVLAAATMSLLLGAGCQLIAFAERSSIGEGGGGGPSWKISGGVTNDASAGATCVDGGTACSGPAECPVPGSDCIAPTCDLGCCGTKVVGEGEACASGVCDGKGSCFQCLSGLNCDAPQSTKCVVNVCTAHACGTALAPAGDTCEDNGGKVCDGKGACVACNVEADCVAQSCNGDHVCVPPSCANHVEDGAETDQDCGGGLCPRCADYKHCAKKEDCISSICDSSSHTCGG